MSETTIDQAPAADETAAQDAPAEDETPVYVEVNHRGGPASLIAVHIDGQQAFDVAAVELVPEAQNPGDVTVTLARTDGSTTTARVVKLDLVAELVDP